MQTTLHFLRSVLAYLVLSVATFFMLQMVFDYASFRTDIDFLKYKQAYIGIPLWRMSFYTHIFSSVLALAAGFTQFSPGVLKKHRKWHRVVGWIYATDILIINFPVGMVMAVYANGLLPTKIAFVLLDSVWFLFTYKAVVAARKGRFAEHKRFMIRSYAMTFSAITLRTWKIVLGHLFHPDPLSLYMTDAWMGFIPNLLFAEWWIRLRMSHPAKADIADKHQEEQPCQDSYKGENKSDNLKSPGTPLPDSVPD